MRSERIVIILLSSELLILMLSCSKMASLGKKKFYLCIKVFIILCRKKKIVSFLIYLLKFQSQHQVCDL